MAFSLNLTYAFGREDSSIVFCLAQKLAQVVELQLPNKLSLEKMHSTLS